MARPAAGRRRDAGVQGDASQYGEDTEAVVRFLSQRTILDKLRHPHLVAVHDLIADEVIAIVMDVAEGENLRTVLVKRQLSGQQS